jgi:hypothetical protein
MIDAKNRLSFNIPSMLDSRLNSSSHHVCSYRMGPLGAISIPNSARMSSSDLCILSSYLKDNILSHLLFDLITQGRYSVTRNNLSVCDSFKGPRRPLKRHTGKPVAFNSNHFKAISPKTVGGRSASTCQKS